MIYNAVINHQADLTDQVGSASIDMQTMSNEPVTSVHITLAKGKAAQWRSATAWIRPAKDVAFMNAVANLSSGVLVNVKKLAYVNQVPIDVPTVGINDRYAVQMNFTYQPIDSPTRVKGRIVIPYLKDTLTDVQIDTHIDSLFACLDPLDYPDKTLNNVKWSKVST